MFPLSLILVALGLCFAHVSVEKAIEEKIYTRFGNGVRVQGVRFLGPKSLKEIQRIELDMEHGKARAVAYVYTGERRFQAVIDALWSYKVYIALRDIPKGSTVDISMFEEEERLAKTVPSDLRLSPEDFKNYVASTFIPKGTVLRKSYLKELPLVSAGEKVEVIYRREYIEIRFDGIAMDSGRMGELVSVKRGDRILRGRVVSKGLVEVLR
ncbi:MAG: flagella basal body P-ring formation protein FlgA [Acidobacteria bacterium]|jgi:flagella basal body P-ring formation protein FlgA|nr:MAG: flagella basal body P-ring formation protein FlgA [Acidobacteriota bacterium]